MVGETTVEFIAILVTVTGLLGWLLKVIINYFIKTAQEKSKYIETLVCQNQSNTEKFTDTINHQRTQDREMQGKHLGAIRELKDEMKSSNEVNKSILEFIKTNK